MKTRSLIRILAVIGLPCLLGSSPLRISAGPASSGVASASDTLIHSNLPENTAGWRGFNLTDMITWPGYDQKPSFKEWDFKTIHDFGFTFVRLPIDYRVWLAKGQEATVMDEDVLRRIDQAVDWGRKYNIHVSLNFHRAPGFCVNVKLPDDGNLWTDASLQKLFIHYWVELAKRYKDVPSESLSFNLINEPNGKDSKQYVALVLRTAKAIWEVSPDRLIIADYYYTLGTSFESIQPLSGFATEPRILQAFHNYRPNELSNYGVTWRDQDWIPFLPRPRWPATQAPSFIVGPLKPKIPLAGKPMLVLKLKDFSGGMFRVRVEKVSAWGALLKIEADGKELKTWELVAVNNPTNPTPIRLQQKDYTVRVPAGTRQVGVSAPVGDWIKLNQAGLQPDGKEESVLPLYFDNRASKLPPEPVAVDFSNAAEPFRVSGKMDEQWLYDKIFRPWHEALGSRFHVGELGTFSGVPHEVTLAWTEDNLRVFKKMKVGWALWEFRGNWGVFDSNRKDVTYEAFEGHKLDRKLLELLQRY